MASQDDPAILRLVYAQARRISSIVYGRPSHDASFPNEKFRAVGQKYNQPAFRRQAAGARDEQKDTHAL
jgi:hypothetical protein